jgi:membrane-associated phospholipid phosphatase
VMVTCVAVALYRRRWRLGAAVVLSPAVAIALVDVLKHVFERRKGIGEFAYPSGHATVMVVVVGLAVVVAGLASWAVLVAVAWCLLGIVGQAVTYHYFTDAIGAVLLGTAVVCVTALISGHPPELDRCQPRCDLRHSQWLP